MAWKNGANAGVAVNPTDLTLGFEPVMRQPYPQCKSLYTHESKHNWLSKHPAGTSRRNWHPCRTGAEESRRRAPAYKTKPRYWGRLLNQTAWISSRTRKWQRIREREKREQSQFDRPFRLTDRPSRLQDHSAVPSNIDTSVASVGETLRSLQEVGGIGQKQSRGLWCLFLILTCRRSLPSLIHSTLDGCDNFPHPPAMLV